MGSKLCFAFSLNFVLFPPELCPEFMLFIISKGFLEFFAPHQCAIMQDVVDHTKTLDSSSGSDDGSISQSQLATKLDSASANGGEPWDVSGVPVDYSFKVCLQLKKHEPQRM